MIGVSRARTVGTIGRELMDTRYRAGEVTSERREIHCRSSAEFIYLNSKTVSTSHPDGILRETTSLTEVLRKEGNEHILREA